jgi:hypothetical protein
MREERQKQWFEKQLVVVWPVVPLLLERGQSREGVPE